MFRHICRGIDALCEQRLFNKAVLTESTRKPNFLSPLLCRSLLQSTGSVSMSSQVPNWKAAPPPSTCATTCWSSPEASLLSSLDTGSCRRCVDTALCQMASCSRGGLAADTVSNFPCEFKHCGLLNTVTGIDEEQPWARAPHTPHSVLMLVCG